MDTVRFPLGGFSMGVNPTDNEVGMDIKQYTIMQNTRIRNDVLVSRTGVTTFSAAFPNARRVVTLHSALLFGVHHLLRFDRQKVHRYNAATNAFIDITGADTFIGTDSDTFCCTEWLNNTRTSAYVYFSNGINPATTQSAGTYKWKFADVALTPLKDNTFTSSGGLYNNWDNSTTAAPGALLPPCRAIVGGWGSRLWLMRTIEGGSAYPQRVRYCSSANDTVWALPDAGAVDLADDPYPIEGGGVIAGRIVVYKGDQEGGSIVVGAQTGDATYPVAWETLNPGSGVGCLSRQTIVPVAANVHIFLGHDDVYMFDGQSLRGIGGATGRQMLKNFNYTYLRQAWAIFRPDEGEYEIYIPEDTGLTYPTARYVFSMRYGAWVGYEPCTYTAGDRYVFTQVYTWNTITGPWLLGGSTVGTTIGSQSWTGLGSNAPSNVQLVYGDNTGGTWKDDGATVKDNNVSFTSKFQTSSIECDSIQIQHGSATRTLRYDDWKSLRSVTLIYKDTAAWTPIVEVSIDGKVSYTTISNGLSIGSGSGAIKRKTYTCFLSSQAFYIRVSFVSSNVKLLDIEPEVQYVGSAQYA